MTDPDYIAELENEAGYTHERGRLTYDDLLGHVCTEHGRTMEALRSVEPTEGGSYYYVCRVCGAGGWSGL